MDITPAKTRRYLSQNTNKTHVVVRQENVGTKFSFDEQCVFKDRSLSIHGYLDEDEDEGSYASMSPGKVGQDRLFTIDDNFPLFAQPYVFIETLEHDHSHKNENKKGQGTNGKTGVEKKDKLEILDLFKSNEEEKAADKNEGRRDGNIPTLEQDGNLNNEDYSISEIEMLIIETINHLKQKTHLVNGPWPKSLAYFIGRLDENISIAEKKINFMNSLTEEELSKFNASHLSKIEEDERRLQDVVNVRNLRHGAAVDILDRIL